MARRGEALREHILFSAKDVFLELGFERASMDAVAARAATSKRSLYAHFAHKEALFLAVVELVRELVLRRLGAPGDGGEAPEAALVAYCARFLDTVTYQGHVRMSRVCMAEAARFPEGAARYHDVVFTEAQTRLSAYMAATFGLGPEEAAARTERLLGRVLHPRWTRALFGVDPPREQFDAASQEAAVRPAVAALLAGL